MTTVGYGDVYPITAAGRIVGGFTMIVGISTFAIVTAKIAEFLVRFDVNARPNGNAPSGNGQDEIKETLRRIEASLNAET